MDPFPCVQSSKRTYQFICTLVHDSLFLFVYFCVYNAFIECDPQRSGFLHFSDNKNKLDKTDENCNWVWKVILVFDMLAIHMLNITVQPNMQQLMKLFVLKQYVQNVMRICKLCDSVEYIYSKVFYADKHRTTHASVRVLTLRTENVGQKIFLISSCI